MYKSLLGCACARQALLCWEMLRLPDAFAELAEWVESARQNAEGIWLYAKGMPGLPEQWCFFATWCDRAAFAEDMTGHVPFV